MSERYAEPVLLIGFNRPQHLERVIDALRSAAPRHVFLAIDGPRDSHPADAERVHACRALARRIDWDAQVETLFQERNLGCGLGVATAIRWFFDHVDRGVILEDDIIPDESFFGFCSELLERYEDNDQVLAISGCNFVPRDHISRPHDAYRFSQVPHIWGWATWRRAWLQHRLDISGWRRTLPLRQLWRKTHRSAPATAYWAAMFESLARGEIDTWDGQLVFAAMVSGQLTATANTNLITNIGFGEDATHTLEDRDELQPVGSMQLPTKPVPIVVDAKADDWTRMHHFHATWAGLAHQATRYVMRRTRRS